MTDLKYTQRKTRWEKMAVLWQEDQLGPLGRIFWEAVVQSYKDQPHNWRLSWRGHGNGFDILLQVRMGDLPELGEVEP